MYPYYSSKKYPSWCICCIESKYLKNKFAAYYHIKKTMSSSKKAKQNLNLRLQVAMSIRLNKQLERKDQQKVLYLQNWNFFTQIAIKVD